MLNSVRRFAWAACLFGLTGSTGDLAAIAETPVWTAALRPGPANTMPRDWQALFASGWR